METSDLPVGAGEGYNFNRMLLTRRQAIGMGLLACGTAVDRLPATPPIDSSVDVTVANVSFASADRPYAAIWTPSQWSAVLGETTYAGLELHKLNQIFGIIGASAIDLLRRQHVHSFHQSFGRRGLGALVFPGVSESLDQLYAAQTQAGHQKYPVVTFPQADLAAVERAVRERRFSNVSVQPETRLIECAGVRTMEDLRDWLGERHIKVCWPTAHYQITEEQLGSDRLGHWQDWLPALVTNQSPQELAETHLELGRIDDGASASQNFRRTTMHELAAFINGPEQALRTTSGHMLAAIFQSLPENIRPRVVVEIYQPALIHQLGTNALWPTLSGILNAHRRIVRTVRDLAQAF